MFDVLILRFFGATSLLRAQRYQLPDYGFRYFVEELLAVIFLFEVSHHLTFCVLRALFFPEDIIH
jgi:hypothetical protein